MKSVFFIIGKTIIIKGGAKTFRTWRLHPAKLDIGLKRKFRKAESTYINKIQTKNLCIELTNMFFRYKKSYLLMLKHEHFLWELTFHKTSLIWQKKETTDFSSTCKMISFSNKIVWIYNLPSKVIRNLFSHQLVCPIPIIQIYFSNKLFTFRRSSTTGAS